MCVSFKSISPISCLHVWNSEFWSQDPRCQWLWNCLGSGDIGVLRCRCWEGDTWDHLLCSIDGFPLSSCLTHLSSMSRLLTLSSKECLFSLRCKWTAESGPEELALLCCHAFVKLLFNLFYLKVCTLLIALHIRLHLCLGVLFFGWTSLWLRVFSGLKCTGKSLFLK